MLLPKNIPNKTKLTQSLLSRENQTSKHVISVHCKLEPNKVFILFVTFSLHCKFPTKQLT